ncbi:hypothetical protein NPIL_203521 [Nephila pilipes]|uniref:Uncharacterized protein n=1 Tax=Nephila pilipes TaxID=299642 RepID=A0A8X6UE79_NEPPI|nr:hypothetical protein NPIL_203521 [Nephila pilipes]
MINGFESIFSSSTSHSLLRRRKDLSPHTHPPLSDLSRSLSNSARTNGYSVVAAVFHFRFRFFFSFSCLTVLCATGPFVEQEREKLQWNGGKVKKTNCSSIQCR